MFKTHTDRSALEQQVQQQQNPNNTNFIFSPDDRDSATNSALLLTTKLPEVYKNVHFASTTPDYCQVQQLTDGTLILYILHNFRKYDIHTAVPYKAQQNTPNNIGTNPKAYHHQYNYPAGTQNYVQCGLSYEFRILNIPPFTLTRLNQTEINDIFHYFTFDVNVLNHTRLFEVYPMMLSELKSKTNGSYQITAASTPLSPAQITPPTTTPGGVMTK